jgi:hypothetical protein
LPGSGGGGKGKASSESKKKGKGSIDADKKPKDGKIGGFLGPVYGDSNDYGDGSHNSTSARTLGVAVRKDAGGKWKMARGASESSASFTKRGGDQTANTQMLKRSLVDRGFVKYSDPMKTKHFYDTGGSSFRNGHVLVNIDRYSHSTSFTVARLDLTLTRPMWHGQD